LIHIAIYSLPLTLLTIITANTVSTLLLADWMMVYSITFLLVVATVALELLSRKLLPITPHTTMHIIITALTTAGLLLYISLENSPVIILILVTSGYILFVISFYSNLGAFILNLRQAPSKTFSCGLIANMIGLIAGTGLGHLVTHQSSTEAGKIIIILTVYAVFFASPFALQVQRKDLRFIHETKKSFDSSELEVSGNTITAGVHNRCRTLADTYCLSIREEEILNLIIRGRNLQQIAKSMNLSHNTIKTHVKHIYSKLNVHTKEEILLIYEKNQA
jgi:DNA-binding CsgD family transcriptional regulator